MDAIQRVLPRDPSSCSAVPGGVWSKLASLLMCGCLMSGCAANSVDDISGMPAASQSVRGPPSVAASATSSTDAAAGDRGQAPVATKSRVPAVVSSAGAPIADIGSYKVGSLDTLEITVFRVPELSKVLTVSEAGSINFPLLGETRVVGMTASEIERELAQKLRAKYLQDPQVNVNVKDFNSQQVTIEGRVRKPGVYAMRGRMSLVQVIALGGGLDELSDEQITVSRVAGGRRVANTYDLAQIRFGSIKDPELQAGDVLYAGTSSVKETLNNIGKITPLATILRPF